MPSYGRLVAATTSTSSPNHIRKGRSQASGVYRHSSAGLLPRHPGQWVYRFLGEKTYGWHYDLIFVVMNLVIVFTNGGGWVLMK